MDNTYKVYSFDVYDTCISRIYEKPSDLFYQLGLLICPITTSSRHEFAIQFTEMRIMAEKVACRAHGRKRSCTLKEIYNLLSLPNACLYSKSTIMKLELQLEEKSTYCIETTRDIVQQLRSEGKRIIFISDMYLAASFIKQQLIKHGFFEEGDKLYVSSESSFIKRTGMLFKLAIKKEKIQAEELFHTGDNIMCDIKPAKKLGIQTTHIHKTHIQPHEIALTGEKFTPIEKRINSIPKYIRLLNPDKYNDAELKLFATILPTIISFTLWTLQKAAEMQLNRVYFVSRNGELPYKAAKLFERYFPKIEIKFLYGSRKAWLLPSMSAQSDDWKYAMPNKSTCSLREVLERLSFEEEEIADIDSTAKSIGFAIDEIAKSKIILDNLIKLIANPAVYEIFFAKINSAREFTVDYFRQEGLLSDDRWAIVDSGWELNCQAHLNRIIKSISPLSEVKGLYFGMVPSHLPEKLTGPAISYTNKLSIFSQRGYVVENCFLFSSLQSTVGYIRGNRNVTPEFSKLSHSNFEKSYSNNVYSYLCEYAKALESCELPPSLFIEHKKVFIENLARFISKPDASIAQHLTALKINEDVKHSNKNSTPLCRKLEISDLQRQVVGFFSSKIKREQLWLEASIHLSSPLIGFLFRALIIMNRARYLITNSFFRKQ